MLINLTNHPSAKWKPQQLDEAKRLFGFITDLPFPGIDPSGDEQYIAALADEYLDKILSLANGRQATIHLMGEMNFTVALINRLRKQSIPCVASTTQRIEEREFQFVRFRQYE